MDIVAHNPILKGIIILYSSSFCPVNMDAPAVL
jgi:hypothetical protein